MNTSFQGTTETGTATWLTPKYIIDALGPFDLDPCAHTEMPWPTAKTMLTIKEDGLKSSWEGFGRVFLNPPYGRTDMNKWLAKMEAHKNGIALVYASTDVDWFKYIWNSNAVLFPTGRIRFCDENGQPGGSPGKGSVLAAWGEDNVDALSWVRYHGIPGKFIKLF